MIVSHVIRLRLGACQRTHPSSKCLHRFSASWVFALQTTHSNLSTTFFVVLAVEFVLAREPSMLSVQSQPTFLVEDGLCLTTITSCQDVSGLVQNQRVVSTPHIVSGHIASVRNMSAMAHKASCSVPYLSLREERSLAGLVLSDLVLSVFAAILAFAILLSC
jgi:hypothetical protein